MRYKSISPHLSTLRGVIALIFVVGTMLLRNCVVQGFRLPQKIAVVTISSGGRIATRSPLFTGRPFPSPLLPIDSFRGLGVASTRYPQQCRSLNSLFNARRSTSTSSPTPTPTPPTVEVSPADHGTTALTSFDPRQNSELDDRLVRKLQRTIGKHAAPTPIQAHAIPLLLNGYDVMASSPTGSGKSIMFGLPLLQRLLLSQESSIGAARSTKNGGIGAPAALIISPTRELAAQIASVLKSFVAARGNSGSGGSNDSERALLNVCLATGGSDLRNQRQQLSSCDVLVGTPGRILQFADERKLSLGSVEYLVVDEADRLLDMGFEPQLTRISRSLKQGRRNRNVGDQQSVLCSATFPSGVQRLAADFLNPDYYFVSVGRVGSTHSNIRQRFEWVNTFFGNNSNRNGNNNRRNFDPKEDAVVRNVEQFWEQTAAAKNPQRKRQSNVIVFTNTKDGAEQYGKALTKSRKRQNISKSYPGTVRVIHGDKPQSERNRAIAEFKSGKASTLVATDVAARGLDISTIGLVVQADAPKNIDTYTHRVGRTGRAGARGEAVTLLDAKSGLGIAAGLIDLLHGADQSNSIPSWLYGMSYISNARALEEELAIQAGTVTTEAATISSSGNEKNAVVINEEFTGQDFRRTAMEGSYGAGRDTSYRSFDEQAYSTDSVIAPAAQINETLPSIETNNQEGAEKEVGKIDLPNVNESTMAKLFQRQRPTQQLVRVVGEINGSAEIGDVPDKVVIDSLAKKGRGNQKLRFEYLGLFPFNVVYPFLISNSSRTNEINHDGTRMPRILMVAEKPSIAKTLAEALSDRRGPRQRRGISRALPVYEFVSDSFRPVNEHYGANTKCLITVTSVVGHVFSLGFDTKNQTERNDPRDFFHLPVVKQEEGTSSKLRVIDHLRALAGESDHLVLWLDCDPEGENIAHEVMAITRQAICSKVGASNDDQNRIHRARFSAISQRALRDAFRSLEEPDPALSRSVDARQELDLRIGVALTRLLTWKCVGMARKRFGPSTRLISYGPCQTPALSFCVSRAREIEEFKPEKYWKVHIDIKLPNGNAKNKFPLLWKVPKDDAVLDTRTNIRKGKAGIIDCASRNQRTAEKMIDHASGSNSHVVVTNIRESIETIPPPLGLNTVALLVAGSTAMGMSPKQVMNVAEKLYSAGFISYPRTETTRYDPNGFDVRSYLKEHSNHNEWGRSASYLLRTKYSKSGRPPLRGKDVGDHPPITPLKAATREEVGGGAAWRVYEFVVRNFIGSLHNELSFTRKVVSLSLPESEESEFELKLVTVNSLGFADCCRWILRDIGAGRKEDSAISLKEGQTIPIANARLEETATKPPRFLQEHELILLMDDNRIGTDASMAVHVSNIVDRGYVTLCDETGQPLRGPRRPGQKQLPRQIGRYMVPSALGMALLDLFDRDERMASQGAQVESPALLSHPSIRRQMEEEVKQIAVGAFDKEYCLEKNLDWFEERYLEFERTLNNKRVKEFGSTISAMKNNVNYWRALGAFEPKSNNNNNVPPKTRPTGSNKAGKKARKWSGRTQGSSTAKKRNGEREGQNKTKKRLKKGSVGKA